MRLGYLGLAAWLPLASLACGVCIEDKMAATYDHAVVTHALERGHAVAFAELFGLPEGNAALLRDVAGAAEVTAGVDRGTARVSAAPPGLSFAFDPKRQTALAVLAHIEQKLVPKGVKIELIRVMDHAGSANGK